MFLQEQVEKSKPSSLTQQRWRPDPPQGPLQPIPVQPSSGVCHAATFLQQVPEKEGQLFQMHNAKKPKAFFFIII